MRYIKELRGKFIKAIYKEISMSKKLYTMNRLQIFLVTLMASLPWGWRRVADDLSRSSWDDENLPLCFHYGFGFTIAALTSHSGLKQIALTTSWRCGLPVVDDP